MTSPLPLVAVSSSMQQLVRHATHFMTNTCPLLLRGEAGTGKTTLARAMHEHGPRRGAPYVALDCRTLSQHPDEGPLQVTRWENTLLRTCGGSFFLHAIEALPKVLQARLARLLTTQRMTGTCTIQFLTSTSADLEEALALERFRADLFYSLIDLLVPPLRERLADLPVLVGQLLHRLRTPGVILAPEAWQALHAHLWPGNLRELAMVMERAVRLRDSDVLTLADFPDIRPVSVAAP
jgi:DNA-binding NtrC family response regulator